jgi:hypothetical protein
MTRDLREVLERQRAITENLQRRLKVVCRACFIARAGLSRASALRFGQPVRKLDVPVASCTTSVEPPFAISSGRVFPSASRCR